MIDIKELEKAIKKAAITADAKTATEKEKVMGKFLFDNIIVELRNSSVSEDIINELEKEINNATDKNEAILRIIQNGGEVADKISAIIKKII